MLFAKAGHCDPVLWYMNWGTLVYKLMNRTVMHNPIALRKTKIVYKFGLSGCNMVKWQFFVNIFKVNSTHSILTVQFM